MTATSVLSQEFRDQLYGVIRSEIPFDEKARELLELGTEYLGTEHGYLTRIEPETNYWKAIVATESGDDHLPPDRDVALRETYCRDTIDDDTPHALHDAPNQGWAEDPAFATWEDHTYLGIPLVPDDGSCGTVCFTAAEPRADPFGDAEILFAELLTRLLERELERTHVETELTSQSNLATVLNRVLRHNIRNDMSVIRGHPQLGTDTVADEHGSETALETVDNLIDLADKARELDRILAADSERQQTDVVALVETVVDTVTREHSSASIAVESEADITATLRPSFERAVGELIENAVRHPNQDPTVTVAIESGPKAVEIRIVDETPGLADGDAEVFSTGEKPAHSNGTGLGLWLAYWVVTSHDGTIDTTDTEEGTVLTISVPRTPARNVQHQLTQLVTIVGADDVERTVEYSATADIVPGQHLSVSRDVTERIDRERRIQAQQQQLRDARDQFQSVFEHSDARMIVDPDTDEILETNQRASDLLEYSREELLSMSPADISPADLEGLQAVVDAGQTGENGRTDTLACVTKSGETLPVEISASGLEFEGRDCVLASIRDDRARRKYQAAFEEASDAMMLLDADARIVAANEAASAIVGMDTPQLLGQAMQEFLLEKEQGADDGPAVHRTNATRDTTTLVDATGTERAVKYSTTTDIVPGEHLVVFRDITERTPGEQEQERYQAAFSEAGDGMTITDDEARITDVNLEAARIYGEDREELLGRPMREFLPNEFDFEAEWGKIQAAKMKRDEMPIMSADGGIQPIEYTAKPNFIPGQHLIVSRDITERKEREQKLERQIERLDNFADVLSHDLRNPLDVAQGRLELASAEFDSEHFEPIERAHERMEALIADLRTTASEGTATTDIEPVDLPTIAEGCWSNVATVDATLDIENERRLQADKSRLKQVFENLFRNAVEHAGADVTVRVGAQDDGFYVADDGPGIPDADRDTVFEDGYSSRQAGTGFGLTIVLQVVEAHGWDIAITDSELGGARFEITGFDSEG